jgi:hypothetical protein
VVAIETAVVVASETEIEHANPQGELLWDVEVLGPDKGDAAPGAGIMSPWDRQARQECLVWDIGHPRRQFVLVKGAGVAPQVGNGRDLAEYAI